MKSCIDEVLRFAARNIKPRPPQPIASRRLRKCDSIRKHASTFAKSGPTNGSLNPGSDYERQSTFITYLDRGVAHSQGLEHFLRLAADGFSVIRFYSRLELDVNSPRLAEFNAYVEIGTNLRARMACLT
jgi:hypothetical protein